MINDELKSYIKDYNEAARAKMAASDDVWIGLLPEEEDFWAEQGISTLEQYERHNLEVFIYEGHKDAFGTKGRHYDFDSMTMDELKAEADYISESIQKAIDAEKEAAQLALDEFEARINEIIEIGAGDRETALRWMIQGEKFYQQQDIEHWVWNQGLLFSEDAEKLCEELKRIVTFVEDEE